MVHSATDMFGELVSFLFSLQSFLLVIILIVTLYTISCLLFPDVPVSDLEKKAVLITGCDSGFGYELAKKLDSRGLQVFAGCLTSDGQAKLRSECFTRMTTLGLDVKSQSDIQKALEVVKSLLSSNGTNGLWAVVNNAGIAVLGPFEWQTIEEMRRTVDVNLWGMVLVTKTFLPLLKRTKGRVINVASTSGRVASPGAMAYSISKFGVEAFSDCLRNEMKHFGVTTHIIEPRNFKTNITSIEKNCQQLERLWAKLDREKKESYGKEYYDQAITFISTMLPLLGSTKIYKVVNAMEHAITSTRPKLRYMIGWDANLLWRTASFLPSEMQDLVYFSFPKPQRISDCKDERESKM